MKHKPKQEVEEKKTRKARFEVRRGKQGQNWWAVVDVKTGESCEFTSGDTATMTAAICNVVAELNEGG